MAYQLEEINRRLKEDPAGFVAECDGVYKKRLETAADRILERMKVSPIVLLSGPSGSGKTTTALKLEQELERRGVQTHTISMDNYFKTLNGGQRPGTPRGTSTMSPPSFWIWTCWMRPLPSSPGESGSLCPSLSLPGRCAMTAGVRP